MPFAVGGYITAAYWFTSSTSFANPAVTIARTLSDTFTGIYPMHAPAFIVMQFIGAGAATALFWWLVPVEGSESSTQVPESSFPRKRESRGGGAVPPAAGPRPAPPGFPLSRE